MLKQLFAKFFSNDLYIQVWEHRIQLTNLQTGEIITEEPLLAIAKDEINLKKIQAFGHPAKTFMYKSDMQVNNPFSHPRLLIANFQQAEKVINHLICQLSRKRTFATSPRVIFQPMEKLEGGVTDIELRVYRELCLGAGAREVAIYLGPPSLVTSMTFEEIKQKGV
jgi:rod shape-determining protein MreB